MDEIVKLSCPHCGGKLNLNIFSNSVTCVYCGQSSLITGSTGLMNSQSRCPMCGDKDLVRKVSVLMFSQDPLKEHLRPPSKPRIPSIEEYLCSINEGAPDSFPAIENPRKKNLLIYLAVILFLFLIMTQVGFQEIGQVFFSILLILIIGAVGYYAYKAWLYNNSIYKALEVEYRLKTEQINEERVRKAETIRNEYEKMAQDSWKKFDLAMKRWDYLYYCSRDGILFVPGGDRYTKVGDMMRYLYSDDM